MIKGLFYFLILFFTSFAVIAQNSTDSFSKLKEVADREGEEAVSKGGITSLQIAVMKEGRFLYKKEFGMRDKENSIPSDSNTQYNIGSISKLFVTIAILQLKDKGLLKLDKPVYQYLPHFRMKDPRYKKITIRMLLNHSAALPGTNYYNGMSIEKNPKHLQETLDLINESRLKSNPGDINVYCNDCFSLAEAIVEHIAKTKYCSYIEKNIFKKLEMKNSSCYFTENNSNVAFSYNPKNGKKMPLEYINLLGTGGVTSTAEDISYLLRGLYEGKLLKEKSLSDFQKKYNAPKGSALSSSVGLGWDYTFLDEFQDDNIQVLAKNGGTTLFFSQSSYAPKEKLSVVVLTTGGADPKNINFKIMRAALEELGAITMNSSNNKSNEIEKKINQKKEAPIPIDFNKYEGLYVLSGKIFKMSFDKTNLYITPYSGDGFDSKTAILCEHKEDGTFFFEKHNVYFSFKTKINPVNKKEEKVLQLTSKKWKGRILEGIIIAEDIDLDSFKNKAKQINSEFKDILWLPRNFVASDLVAPSEVGICQTKEIKEIPRAIVLNCLGRAFPYAFYSKLEAKNIFPYSRDVDEIKITRENNNKILHIGRLEFFEGKDIKPFDIKEKVVIGEKSYNEIRKITGSEVNKINFEIPQMGRIIIYSELAPFEIIFDSLFDELKPILITKNSYIVYIGKEKMTFSHME